MIILKSLVFAALIIGIISVILTAFILFTDAVEDAVNGRTKEK